MFKLGLIAVATATDSLPGGDGNWQQYVPEADRHYIHDNSTQNSSVVATASQDQISQQYRHRYADQYIHQYAGQNENRSHNLSSGERPAIAQHYIDKYAGQYNRTSSHDGGDGNWQQYVPEDDRHYIHDNSTQNSSVMLVATWQQYVPEADRHYIHDNSTQNSSVVATASQDQISQQYRHRYADQYMHQYAGQNENRSHNLSSGERPAIAQHYIDKYAGQYNRTSSHDGGDGNWQQYVPEADRHYIHDNSTQNSSVVATGGASGQGQSGNYSQYMQQSAPGGAQAAGPARAAPARAEGSSSSTAVSAVSLAASPTQSEPEATRWSSLQLVACVVAGFSLPAALAFVSTLRKTSRLPTEFEDAGFQRLMEV